MSRTSKKTQLLVLGITAIGCSGTMLHSFNDPEGPNLLVIIVMALILFAASLVTYVFKFPVMPRTRLLLAVFSQIVLAASLYFFLR